MRFRQFQTSAGSRPSVWYFSDKGCIPRSSRDGSRSMPSVFTPQHGPKHPRCQSRTRPSVSSDRMQTRRVSEIVSLCSGRRKANRPRHVSSPSILFPRSSPSSWLVPSFHLSLDPLTCNVPLRELCFPAPSSPDLWLVSLLVTSFHPADPHVRQSRLSRLNPIQCRTSTTNSGFALSGHSPGFPLAA